MKEKIKIIKNKGFLRFLVIFITLVSVWGWWYKIDNLETKCPVISEREEKKYYSVECLNSEREDRFRSLLMFDGTVIISSILLLYLIEKYHPKQS